MKFRKSLLSIIAISAFALIGCEKDQVNDKIVEKSSNNYESLDLSFYGNYDPNTDRKISLNKDFTYEFEEDTYTSNLKIEYNLTDESVIDISIESEFFDITSINIDDFEGEFDDYHYETKGDHKDCMDECNDEFRDEDGNKLDGLGRCRTNCWIDTAVRVIEAIGSFFTIEINF